MNDNTYYKSCQSCGRPQTFCKGECCGKPQGCCCREYGPKVQGCIRQVAPKCPYEAVIPSITVDTVENIKNLADCFVHVADINTTFYIDDKHRIITTWAGPVEYDNYDLAANPLGLRSQFLIDFANERGAYYDKTGAYEVFSFGGSAADDAMYLRVTVDEDSDEDWNVSWDKDATTGLDPDGYFYDMATLRAPESLVSFVDEADGTAYDANGVYALLESGKKVVLNNVPLGAYIDGDSIESDIVFHTTVDGVELKTKTSDYFDDVADYFTSYTGGAFVETINGQTRAFFGTWISRHPQSGDCEFFVQARGLRQVIS